MLLTAWYNWKVLKSYFNQFQSPCHFIKLDGTWSIKAINNPLCSIICVYHIIHWVTHCRKKSRVKQGLNYSHSWTLQVSWWFSEVAYVISTNSIWFHPNQPTEPTQQTHLWQWDKTDLQDLGTSEWLKSMVRRKNDITDFFIFLEKITGKKHWNYEIDRLSGFISHFAWISWSHITLITENPLILSHQYETILATASRKPTSISLWSSPSIGLRGFIRQKMWHTREPTKKLKVGPR